ncbi:MAG: DUF456 domain-containing protein [Thermomonas sp.]|uniref:DUF456 domain-containing protein n=1 Tax=Thermomonas sp. TaxID=1971895 RepID=UPI0039E4EB6F
MDPNTLLYAIAAILVLVGLAGTVLPALPGLPLLFAGLLLAAWTDGFQHIHWGWLLLLGLLTLLSLVIDLWATALGAKRVGASRLAVLGAMLGTLAGLFFGPVGLLLGPFAGALCGELLHRRSLQRDDFGQAAKIGIGTWLGILFGAVLKIALACMMLGLFALAWWF